MVRWLRWHCPPDTGFEIRALSVWGRARYLSVTEAPHNTNFHTWMGKKHFCFFQTAETGNRTPNSGVKGSDANHYPRAPAHYNYVIITLAANVWGNTSPVPVVTYYAEFILFSGISHEYKTIQTVAWHFSQYCGELLWPRGSVLGLRPTGLEFRILCLEDSVISIISPSSGGSPGPV